MQRLTLAHGFTQTARSWDRFVALLEGRSGPDRVITTLDLPGHGAAATIATDLWGSAERLVRTGGAGTYIGYSMGGRVALHAALAHPAAVRRLVLIGATPGILDETERRQRRAADEALADHIEAVGVETFIDEWLTNPLFAGLTDETAQRADRRRNTAAGLASSLRCTGTGTQQPLWDRLGDIACPVLLVVGASDAKFRAIAASMAERLGDATVAIIDGAGHSAHLEQPAATVTAVADWLDDRLDD